MAIASLDRPAARTLLAEWGLAPVDVEDVLASTHCTPPPAYLVLSTKLLARAQAIRDLAGWDFDRSVIAAPSSRAPTAHGLDLAWRSCARRADATEWECAPPEEDACGRRGTFAYRPDAPERSRFLVSDDEGAEQEAVPAVIVLAEAAGLHDLRPATGTDLELGVLVDVPECRALVGPPDLVRSTLVHLLYLDGR